LRFLISATYIKLEKAQEKAMLVSRTVRARNHEDARSKFLKIMKEYYMQNRTPIIRSTIICCREAEPLPITKY